MPRRGGGGGARPAPRRPTAAPPPPRPTATSRAAPPPAPQQQQSSGGSMLGSMAGMVAQGMAMGTGSAIAHRAVGAVMGPVSSYGTSSAPEGQAAPQAAEPQGQCGNQMKAFNDCINQNVGDINKCQVYVDMLQACKRGELV